MEIQEFECSQNNFETERSQFQNLMQNQNSTVIKIATVIKNFIYLYKNWHIGKWNRNKPLC